MATFQLTSRDLRSGKVMYPIKLPSSEEMELNKLLARHKNGILVSASFLTSNGLYDMDSQKVSLIFFIPLVPDSFCPCGSGKEYALCCKRHGLNVVFAQNIDGKTYSRLVCCRKTFKRFNFENVRKAMLGDYRFACAEDSMRRCFWNFLGYPHTATPYGKLVFGTVELTRRFLKFETMNEKRFEHLGKVFDELLGTTIGDASVKKIKI